jgi:LysR family hca operon transcriptional activator
LLSRSVHGVALTAAGTAFLDHARLALMQVDAAVEAARKETHPAKKTFAIGFQTGQEMDWLPQAMAVLRDELKNIEVAVTSDYSPDLAEALARGRLDLAFLRMEPGYDLGYHVVDREPLIVLMPSDHRLTRQAIHPREFVGEIFIGGPPPCCAKSPGLPSARGRGRQARPRRGQRRWPCLWSPDSRAGADARRQNLCPRPWSAARWRQAPMIDVAWLQQVEHLADRKLFLSRLDELVRPKVAGRNSEAYSAKSISTPTRSQNADQARA